MASQKSKLLIASTSYMGVWQPKDTYEFLEHCHALGAAGIQAGVHGDIAGEATTRADVTRIRRRAEQLGMQMEAMVVMPDGADTAAFEQALKDARDVGATALRAACLGTRRYQTFATSDAWQQHVQKCHHSIAATIPLLDKYKIPLGLENHKDWTTEELLTLMRQYSSEYFGVCLDFGNNISLLDPDPMDTIEKLAPYVVTTHLKDMAVDVDDEGFQMSEVPLGQGYLDLPRAIQIVQQARPRLRWSLEMITRDPLRIPCLADKFWATFPARNGLYLARTLRFINSHKSKQPLPRISHLDRDAQLAAENQNVIACIDYASEKLAL